MLNELGKLSLAPILHRIMDNRDCHESFGEVFEKGTKGDNPKSVMSHEDIPLTNSKLIIISSVNLIILCCVYFYNCVLVYSGPYNCVC